MMPRVKLSGVVEGLEVRRRVPLCYRVFAVVVLVSG